MGEDEFSLPRIRPYKDRIVDSALIRENTGQRKPVFSHILCSKTPLLMIYWIKKNNKKTAVFI